MAKQATTTADDAKPQTITRALRVEIVKPLNATWDEAGTVMRDIRSIVHRLYTGAALSAIEADRAKRRGDTNATHPQTAAYRAVEEELVELREWALKKRKGEDAGTLSRLSALQLPGGMKAGISAAAFAGFRKWVKGAKRDRVPTWKHGAPIPVRAQESSLRMDGNGVVLTAKLTPVGRHEFAVRAGKGAHWERLRSLARGDSGLKMGDVKIIYGVREKKWFAFITYTEPKPPPPTGLDPSHVMVIHRGQRNLLVCATSEGRYAVLSTGTKLRAFKRQMSARRLSIKNVTRHERGDGAKGHGRNRYYALPESLAKKERDYVHTLCQQMGARVVELAKAWGCGTIKIEAYGGIEPSDDRGKRMYLDRFPSAELRGCIEWSLRKEGIGLGEYDHAFMSQTCPRCDDVRDANHNKRTGVFHCRACSFDRPVDVVGCIHALRRATEDATAGAWEARLKAEQRMADALKGQEERGDA